MDIHSKKFDVKKIKHLSDYCKKIRELKTELKNDFATVPTVFRDSIIYAVSQGMTNATYSSSEDIDTSILLDMGFSVEKRILDGIDRAGNHTKKYFISWE